MTREELDERIIESLQQFKFQVDMNRDSYADEGDDEYPSILRGCSKELKQLIRDCIEAVTPEKVFEIKADTYSAGVHDGINHAVSDLEANTKDLLG